MPDAKPIDGNASACDDGEIAANEPMQSAQAMRARARVAVALRPLRAGGPS
jgi:hypothetical protein